jgi:hypothetical protein
VQPQKWINQTRKKQCQTCLPELPNQNTRLIPRTPNHDKKTTHVKQERCVSALQNRGGSLTKEEEVRGTKGGNGLPKLSRNTGGKHAKLATFTLIERHKQQPYPRSPRFLPRLPPFHTTLCKQTKHRRCLHMARRRLSPCSPLAFYIYLFIYKQKNFS